MLNLFVKRPHASSAKKNTNGEITDISGNKIKVYLHDSARGEAPTMYAIKHKWGTALYS